MLMGTKYWNLAIMRGIPEPQRLRFVELPRKMLRGMEGAPTLLHNFCFKKNQLMLMIMHPHALQGICLFFSSSFSMHTSNFGVILSRLGLT